MKLKSFIPVTREKTSNREPWQPFGSLQREIDRVFDDFAHGFRPFAAPELMPCMDIVETDKELEITAELPGLEEKDVLVNLSDNLLTIRGEKKVEKEQSEKDCRLVERSYGSFSRSLELPSGINPDMIKATIAKGVLKVTVPKPAPAQTKKIDVKVAA